MIQGGSTYVSGQEVDDLEAMLDDPDCQELLAVVAAVHHEGVDESLDDGALGLAEPLGGEPEGRDRINGGLCFCHIETG